MSNQALTKDRFRAKQPISSGRSQSLWQPQGVQPEVRVLPGSWRRHMDNLLSLTRTGCRSRLRSPSRRRAARKNMKSTSASLTQASDAKPTCCAHILVIYCAASCRRSGGKGFVRHLRQEVLPVAFAQTGHTHRASRALAYTRLCADQLARRVPNTYTQTAASSASHVHADRSGPYRSRCRGKTAGGIG